MKPLLLSSITRVSRLTCERMLGSMPPAPALATKARSDASPVRATLASGATLRAASVGDSASRAWSAVEVSCGRGSPGRGGRSSAFGGMVSGECETILNSSGENFLPPPRLSKALQPPRVAAARAMKAAGKSSFRLIICPWDRFCPPIMAVSGRASFLADQGIDQHQTDTHHDRRIGDVE